ncbi:hypothetical protein RHMOL_Rhmol04G0084500 [Rhododendron molle]|uniref:Uncharacterized protein n=1 Tax=Rhododendron molle TaxID=49168 RepID=A0ACC0NZG2_RHOML|nr:hypothetical protein RHMOL_Rhmol04G0084500 [Rhododendron molle]
MAIAKTNGVWVDDKKLFVQEAVFGQKDVKNRISIPKFQDVGTEKNWQKQTEKEKEGAKKKETQEGDDRVKNVKSTWAGKSFVQIVTG